MDVRADARPAKRRRLSNVYDQQAQTASTSPRAKLHLSLMGSPEPLAESKRSDGSGANRANRACLLDGAHRSSSKDSLTKIEPELPECCYGMLCDIPVSLRCRLSSNSKNIRVDFRGPNLLSSKLNQDSITFDILCPVSARILCDLQNAAEIDTQLDCYSKLVFPSVGSTQQHGRRVGKPSQTWSLNIIIFGRKGLEEKVGEYLSRHKLYLQDPLGCERSVPYRNPHIIQSDSDETVMTDSFNSQIEDQEIERLEAGPDLLAQLMEDDITLPETEAPDLVKTALFRHQKQALTFMLRREEGWDLKDGTRDIWRLQRDSRGRFSYVNNVSGYITDEAPPGFRGGLLADDMGLGKTLSMISLIATNQAPLPTSRMAPGCPSPITPNIPKATLLIVPPALIQAWESQFSLHLRPEKLKCYIYHGQNRKGTEFLELYDVIITTYYTVSSIWRKRKAHPENEKSIFSLSWHRVILDEAHIIQNPQSQLAQACCAIRSERRWAITGTPIQNKLADFASIVKFLQVHPYCEQKTFEEEIFKPWQNDRGTNAQGFLRLKTLVRAITISRTKNVIKLPPRVNEIHHLNFTPAERERYEAAKFQSRALLEDAISSGNKGYKTFNALRLLNILRLICNHGVLVQSTLGKGSPQTPQGSSAVWSPGSDSSLGNMFGVVSCSSCGANLVEDILEGSVSSGIENERHITDSERMICERCDSQTDEEKIGRLHLNDLDLPDSARISAPSTPVVDSNVAFSIEFMSTKIKALVADLDKHIITKKSVVFSYWTNTLDLVQLLLNDKGIPYTRIDGKTSLAKRTDALHAFQQDESIRVILVSITCGGAGLDLTAGSRAYLLEPHWNPMIEEQALCRVHRVGQTRGVTTIRYLMRDSFEEQIVDIQKRKKMLAQVTFTQGPLSEAGIGLGTLQYLKSVLG